MSKFRGITWNNAMFGPKIQVRRSIDLAELGDFGNITDDPHDLPTSGALHRDWTDSAQTPINGSKSGTRLYTDLRYVDSNVVDTQDMGLISDTASTHRVWSSTGAITDIVTSAPSTLYNPGSSSSSGYELSGSTVSELYTLSNIHSNLGVGSTNFAFGDNGEVVTISLIWNTNYFRYTYDLTTAYDLSTATNLRGTTQGYVGHGEQVGFNDDGTKFYVERQGLIAQLDLTTAYTIGNYSGSSFDGTVGTQLGTGTAYKGFFFNSDGTKIYTADNTAREFHEYDLSTAWDLDTSSSTYTSYDFSSDIASAGDIKGFVATSDLSKFYVLTDEENIHEFEMSTAGDITTSSLSTTLDISSDVTTAYDLQIKHDDSELYVLDGSKIHTVSLQEVTTTSSSTTSTATYSGPALDADYALDFSSTNNYLSVDQDDASGWFSNSSGWSIELWFKHSSSSYHMNDGIVNQYGNVVLINGAGGSSIQWSGYSSSTAGYQLSSTTTISDTDWHHLHIGYDGTTVRMFLDGSLEDSTTTAVYGDNANGDFLIGAREGGFTPGVTNYWNGYIADVHITSGGTTSVRTSAYDVDDVYAPTKNDETVLLVYGTSSGIENDTTVTVTEEGSGSAIGYSSAQPWAGWSVDNITYDGRYTFTKSQMTATGGGSASYDMARGIFFNPDGTRLYHLAGGAFANSAMIYGMSLSNAWDVTSGTIDPDAYVANLNDDFKGFFSSSPTTYDTNLTTITWDPTGTRMWVFGNTYDTVIEYSLSTAWDISTMSVENKYISYSYTNETVASDWTNLYQGGTSALQSLHGNAPYGNVYGAEWRDGGTKLFVSKSGYDSYEIHVYEYSTAYDLTTLTSKTISNTYYGISADANNDNIADINQSPYELAWSLNGVLNHNGTSTLRVHQKFDTDNYTGASSGTGNGLNGWEVVIVKADLGSPYDPSTSYDYDDQADLTGLSGMNGYGYKPNGQIAFSPNGKKLYVMSYYQEDDGAFTSWSNLTAAVYQYSIG